MPLEGTANRYAAWTPSRVVMCPGEPGAGFGKMPARLPHWLSSWFGSSTYQSGFGVCVQPGAKAIGNAGTLVGTGGVSNDAFTGPLSTRTLSKSQMPPATSGAG